MSTHRNSAPTLQRHLSLVQYSSPQNLVCLAWKHAVYHLFIATQMLFTWWHNVHTAVPSSVTLQQWTFLLVPSLHWIPSTLPSIAKPPSHSSLPCSCHSAAFTYVPLGFKWLERCRHLASSFALSPSFPVKNILVHMRSKSIMGKNFF